MEAMWHEADLESMGADADFTRVWQQHGRVSHDGLFYTYWPAG